MADWFSEITRASVGPSAPPPSDSDWFSSVARDTQQVPPAVKPDAPIASDPSKRVGIGSRFVAGFSSNEDETIRYYASQLYPNEPVDHAVSRFGKRGDRLFHKADDGNLYEVVARSGPSALAGTVAEGAGSALPVGSGAAAAILTAPAAATGVGALGTFAATTGAAAGGEVARQKIGDVLMGDASTKDVNWWNVAGEGLMSGAGQVAGGGMGRSAERAQVRDISRYNPQATQRAYDTARQERITITPGQATGLRSLQAEEKRLNTRVPETSDQMREFLETQSRQIEDAWHTKLGTIAPQRDAEATARSVRDAAQSALKDVQTARQNAARPLYQAWEAQGSAVATQDVLRSLDAELTTAARGGATAQALNKVKGFLTDAKGNPITDPVRLHNARIEISNIIDTRSADGTSLNNTIVGRLVDIKKQLTDRMDAASIDPKTGRSLYMDARQTFSDLSDDYNDVMGSALKRITDLNDTNLLSVVRETFNPASRSPEMIGKLKARIAGKDPEAWQDLKRLWLQDVVSDRLKTAQSGEVLNPAGKILSALDDPGVRRSLNAALEPQEREGIANLTYVLRRIANAKLGMGSDTAANIAADKDALARATPVWARAARRIGTVLNPLAWEGGLGRMSEAASERNLRNQAQQMVDLVTSGSPDALSALRALRQLNSNQWRALAASGQLAVRGLPVAVDAGMDAVTADEE